MKKMIIVALMAVTGLVAMSAESKNNNPELLAISLIAKYEGFRSTVYKCPGGRTTIGYGFADPDIVAKGTITRKEADRILGKMVRSNLKFIRTKLPGLTPSQQAAVCSFVHNFGRQGLLNSTYYKMLKAGKYAQARVECMKWVHVKKWNSKTNQYDSVVLKGLVSRRSHECRYL